ncbi:hypothetical protein COOONC_07302 [Cooperia oncophora]
MKLIFLVLVGLLVVAANAIEQETNDDDESELATVNANDDGFSITLEKADGDDEVETAIEPTRVKRGARRSLAKRRRINRFKHRRARALRRRHAKNIRRAAKKRARHQRRARIVHRRIARNRRRQRIARG